MKYYWEHSIRDSCSTVMTEEPLLSMLSEYNLADEDNPSCPRLLQLGTPSYAMLNSSEVME